MRWIFSLLFFSLMHLQSAWGSNIVLHIGNQRIQATIADTPQSRKQGLMHHSHLCKNCGMLFVFPKPGKYAFWMKDTPLHLSIAFISADGIILHIAEMQANTLVTHAARGEILYALEMEKSWFSRHRIKASDHVEGLQQTRAGQ